MRRPRWAFLLMLVVGAALGVAIAGVPSRGQDPPLRVRTESTTTTTMATTTTVATTSTTSPSATTTTARRRARR